MTIKTQNKITKWPQSASRTSIIFRDDYFHNFLSFGCRYSNQFESSGIDSNRIEMPQSRSSVLWYSFAPLPRRRSLILYSPVLFPWPIFVTLKRQVKLQVFPSDTAVSNIELLPLDVKSICFRRLSMRLTTYLVNH